MAYRNAVLAMFVVCGVAAAQNVNMNCHIDNEGEIWLNGVQYQPLPRTDPEKAGQDSTVVVVPVQQGTNVLAIRCIDHGWTAGFAASLDLNEVGTSDTVRSDGTWKCTGHRSGLVGSDISTSSYDISTWLQAGDYGLLIDTTRDFYHRWAIKLGQEVQNLYYDQARWVWGPKTVYIRKVFTPDAATGRVLIRGNGYTHKAYLNGALVGENDTEAEHAAAPWIADVTLNAGVENVIAIEATCVDSVDMAWFKAAVIRNETHSYVLSDSTWKYLCVDQPSSLPDGWNATGFDDASWLTVGAFDFYDGKTDPLKADGCYWIWPNDFWFRTTFEAPVVGTLRITKARRPNMTPATAEYFNLRGQRVQANAATQLRTNGVLIQRADMSNGQTVNKVMQLAK